MQTAVPARASGKAVGTDTGTSNKNHLTANAVPASPPLVPQQQSPYKALRDWGDFPQRYSQLAERAQHGDAGAAMDLYENLSECNGVPSSVESLKDMQEHMASEYRTDSQAYNNSVAVLNKSFQQCSLLTDEQKNTAKHWLSVSAELGNPKARLAYVLRGEPDSGSDTYYHDMQDYDANAARYLTDEIDAGNSNALLIASIAYGPHGAFAEDPAKAYSYLYAYSLAAADNPDAMVNRLQALGQTLSSSQLQAATAQGEAIYKKCCIR